MGLIQLGTFDQRQGGQLLVNGDGWAPAGWARVLGSHNDQQQSGGAMPRFDGNLEGAQVGHDVFAFSGESGQRDHLGLFLGYTRANGSVHGNVGGFDDIRAGDLRSHGDSIGAYWTHITASNAYIDAVLMGTWFNTSVNSIQGFQNNTHGRSISASLETGKTIALGSWLSVEPQAQVIMQHITTDGFTDPVSTVTFNPTNAVTGRIGARLLGDVSNGPQHWQPYLKLNLWRSFHRDYNALFGTDAISTNLASTALEFGGGVNATLSDHVSVYGEASYLHNIDSLHRRGAMGDVGIRILWGGAPAH